MTEGKQSFSFDAPDDHMGLWKADAQSRGFTSFADYVRSALAAFEGLEGSATVRVPGEAAAAAGDPGRSSEPRKGLKRSRPSAEACKHPRHGMKGWKCPGCREMF